MNTRETFQALLDGKKVRDRDWPAGVYIFIDEQGGVAAMDGDGFSLAVNLFINEDTKFEICQPAKKKLYKALFRDSVGFNSSPRYFESEACAREWATGFVKLLDEYVEVDDA